MIPAIILPVVRRAILDLLFDVGGEHNDETLTILLNQLGHRVARRDVADQLRWLATENRDDPLIAVDQLGAYLAARILSDGRDVAEGRLIVEGVSRFKTGD